MQWHDVTTRMVRFLEPLGHIESRIAGTNLTARLRRMQGRLITRRWLVVCAAIVLTALCLANDVPFLQFLSAVVAISFAASVIPRSPSPPELIPSSLVEVQVAKPLAPRSLPWAELTDALPDPSVLLSGDHVVLHANSGAQAIFPRLRNGTEIGHIIRQPEFADLLSDVETAKGPLEVEFTERVPVQRALSARAVLLDLPSHLTDQDDDAEAELNAPNVAPPVYLVTIRDLTEQGRFAQMRSDFVSYASHELNTPLASVLGIIETLQGPARNDEQMRDQFLDIMAAEAERMSRLIEDLLELSRVEMKMHVLPKQRVEMTAVARQVVDLLQGAATERNTTLEMVSDGAPSFVRGDYDGLVRMLLNLVNNAIRYGRDGGHIVVSVSVQESELSELARAAQAIAPRHPEDVTSVLVLQVSDDGPGIAEHHIPRLTERFYRVDTASSRARGGTGLGLSIVKNIVNRHRGRLAILSTVGQGSTFRVELPVLRVNDDGTSREQ